MENYDQDNKEKYKEIIDSWINTEKKQTCGSESQERYIKDHLQRFKYIFNLSTKLLSQKETCILDVGRSYLSTMTSTYYQNVVTMGFDIQDDQGGHREAEKVNMEHIVFDLNESRDVDKWPERKFDLIIFSEVIEHLHEAPEFVFLLLSSMLNKNGYIICTTPNFSFIRNRLSCLIGNNPNSKIRFYKENPAHFREYTKAELIGIVKKSELSVYNHKYINFPIKVTNTKTKFIRIISNLVPSFRASHILILQKK